MEAVGKTCPYCRSKIAEGEEAVVCSVCEMPHHLECWVENRSCTTFGCPGTIVSASSGASAAGGPAPEAPRPERFTAWGEAAMEPAPPAQGKRCPQCGFSLPAEALFCRRCGTPAPKEKPVPQPPPPPPPRDRYCVNCGQKADADAVFCKKCGARIPVMPG